MLVYNLPLLVPLLLAAAAILMRTTKLPPQRTAALAEGVMVVVMGLSVATAAVLVGQGSGTSTLWGLFGFGLSARIDSLSVIMLLLVAFIGWVVVRYARTYLDGEARQNAFTSGLLATIAAVSLLVQAGNLSQFVAAWIAMGFFLHGLLLFYPDRPAAQRAARKKFIVARAGDITLLMAAGLLAAAYQTTDIATILQAANVAAGGAMGVAAAALIALAAVLKSAQFPTHGWLTEVMETPTPVSALLHAGVVNAGGFILIRFADVILLSPLVMAGLVIVGGFTALFGGLVMLTQPAVKSSLAWSTVAQMGFMILQCGLALFPLALLHIVAHSLYKAHAFLASGGAVETVAAIRRPGPVAVPDLGAVGKAFAAAIAIYALVFAGYGLIFGFDSKSPQAIALGAILIFGVAYLLAQGIADAAPRALTLRTSLYSMATALSYFALQSVAEWLTKDTLPATPATGPLEWALILLALFSFGAVALAQATFPLWAQHPAATGLRVHLSNGLYINAVTNRLLNSWATRPSRHKGEA